MIVKLQIKLQPNKGSGPIMHVFDRNRQVYFTAPASPEFIEAINGRRWGYFYARLIDTRLELRNKAPPQEW